MPASSYLHPGHPIVENLLEFESVVLRRRMVRHFSGEDVADSDIAAIMSLALHAPSAGFSQGSSYVVVRDEATRKQLAEAQGELGYVSGGFDPFISASPVLIVPCVSEKVYHDRYREPDKLEPDGTEIEWPVPYWYFDIGAGCMIILLAAVDRGLAAAFTGTFDPSAVRRILDIPEDRHPVGVISIGHPLPDKRSPSLKRGRKPVAQQVFYEAYGRSK
jgi:nitroreductase